MFRKALISTLMLLLLVLQACYISLAEGFILWLVVQGLSGFSLDLSFWMCVLLCYAPNFIYTSSRAYKALKSN